MIKKKRRVPTTSKGIRSNHQKDKEPYPDNDPEWAQLEERYSQINDDMRKLAELLPTEQPMD